MYSFKKMKCISCIVFSLLIIPTVNAETEPATEITNSEQLFTLTQAYYDDFNDYYEDLLALLDEYQYQREGLPVDNLIAQVIQLLVNKVNETRHNIWTLNRLLCAELFHERLDQFSARAYDIIILSLDTSLEIVEIDIEELNELPRKIPSMVEVPLLVKKHATTIEQLKRAKKTLLHVSGQMANQKIITDAEEQSINVRKEEQALL